MKPVLATAIILLFLGGCAARKPLPDPSRQNVWLCQEGKEPCSQVAPDDKFPKAIKCDAIPGADSSEVVVCEAKAPKLRHVVACCSSDIYLKQGHHIE